VYQTHGPARFWKRTETLPPEQAHEAARRSQIVAPIEKGPHEQVGVAASGRQDRVDHLEIGGVAVRAGDRVRLKPRPGLENIMDLALAGSGGKQWKPLSQDYEGRQHVCVIN